MRPPEHAELWVGSLKRHALPRIGGMRISEVTSADVIGIPAPIWHGKAATARKLRQRIRSVMEWAVAMDLRPDNPCDRIGPVLGLQRNGARHMRASPHGEVAEAIRKVRASKARPVMKLAFELLVLTATRSGEVRGAAWKEIDRETGLWSIPAPRTKRNREHRVPLCGRVLDAEARKLARGSLLVFPSVGGKPIGNTAMSELLRELGIAALPHGLRSSFRDWAAEETDHPREVAEAALAHKARNQIEGAYRRNDFFERRRNLMQHWSKCLTCALRRLVTDGSSWRISRCRRTHPLPQPLTLTPQASRCGVAGLAVASRRREIRSSQQASSPGRRDPAASPGRLPGPLHISLPC